MAMEDAGKSSSERLWLPLHAVVSSVKDWTKSSQKVTKQQRKRAHAAAQFYSECSFSGILPSEADKAAIEAQERHEKWWTNTKYKKGVCKEESESNEVPEMKRRRMDLTLPESEDMQTHSIHILSEDESSHKRPFSLSEETQSNSIRQVPLSARFHIDEITHCKRVAIDDLQRTGGDTQSQIFLRCLKVLENSYSSRKLDTRWKSTDDATPMDGKWLTLSKPTFADCLGTNEQGDYRYTLGRLSFDMFRPSNLTCSIQGVYNSIGCETREGTNFMRRPLIFPVKLKEELKAESTKSLVRNFDVEVSLTIEPGQTRNGKDVSKMAPVDGFVLRKPIRAFLTNHGHCIPDPTKPNRISIWFVGGSLTPQDKETDMETWKELFDASRFPGRDLSGLARVLAAKILLGAKMPESVSDDGVMTYTFSHPIGGHNQVFCDVLYADDSFRILKGHHGSIFVFTRIPDFSFQIDSRR